MCVLCRPTSRRVFVCVYVCVGWAGGCSTFCVGVRGLCPNGYRLGSGAFDVRRSAVCVCLDAIMPLPICWSGFGSALVSAGTAVFVCWACAVLCAALRCELGVCLTGVVLKRAVLGRVTPAPVSTVCVRVWQVWPLPQVLESKAPKGHAGKCGVAYKRSVSGKARRSMEGWHANACAAWCLWY